MTTLRADRETNMDTGLIPCYASVLLWIHVVASAVPPPSNVTLHCHNMQNTLSWVYDDAEHGLRFKVFIGSQAMESRDLWVDAPKMSIDLSEFSDPDSDTVVMVHAVKGGVESAPEPEEGIVYSYFKDSPASQRCTLDFPLVNLTTLEENHLHFSFTHPGVLYPSKRPRKKKSHESQNSLPEFEYHIDVLNQSQSHTYSCRERECQGKLRVHGSEKSYCLNISGEMKKMSVLATKMYCSEPPKPPEINPAAYIIPVVLVLVGAVVIGAMVFVKKTRPGLSTSVPVPNALEFPATNNNHQQQNYAALDTSDYAVAELEPSSPVPLLPDQDTSNDSSTFRDEVRLHLGVPDDDNENAAQEEAQGAQEDGYSPGDRLDEEEEEEEGEEEQTCSAYERREKVGPN